MVRPVSLPARASANCPRCGLANADAGDGFCAQCGNRLGGTIVPPLIPVGTWIAGHEVVGERGVDLVVRTAKHGALETVLLALGSATLLALEADALRRLRGHAPVPKPLEVGEDPTFGPFLTLSLVDAAGRPVADAARSLPLAGVVRFGRQVVDLSAQIGDAGFVWAPFPDDFWLDDGGNLALSRLRCSARLPAGAAPDVRSAFEAAGGALMPLPTSRGPTRLVRLFSARLTAEPSERLSPEAARAELGRAESELAAPPEETSPGLSAVSDRGLRHGRNEDAVATAAGEVAGEPWAIMVVCDGVASSASASRAAATAAETTRDALAAFAATGARALEGARAAMSQAIGAAHGALGTMPLSSVAGHSPRKEDPPGTTLVAALVLGRTLVLGWVGDSRAYWISSRTGALLTRDHSIAAERVLRGEMTEAEAMVSPFAHTLTRCLGPLEPRGESFDVEGPALAVHALSGPGHLVLCTDGLWNYFPTALDIASIVRVAGAGANSAVIARCLLNHALSRGGADNVSVAVYRPA